jgi:hypothetical protein
MHTVRYSLHPKSGSWTTHPDAHSPDYRLLGFMMAVECDGKRLGGNNVQVVLGAPDSPRRGLDEDVAMWLDSGWWVTLRNQFAQAPDVAARIVQSVADDLSALTGDATAARGVDAEKVTRRVFTTVVETEGPAYWA